MSTPNNNQSNIEYDDVYVVEERTMPVNEVENVEDDELNEELTLSLSSSEESVGIFKSDFDNLKLASEKSKRKLNKKDREKIDQMLEDNLDFKPKTIKRAEVVEDFLSEKFKNMTGSIIRIDSGFSVVH